MRDIVETCAAAHLTQAETARILGKSRRFAWYWNRHGISFYDKKTPLTDAQVAERKAFLEAHDGRV